MHASKIEPAMGELTCSNALLGDPAALAAAWDRDGYWFFRDVLDTDVVARIRRAYVDYLADMGLVDPADPNARYNGADYSELPINSNQSRLNDDRVDRMIHESPEINLFFTRLFGCDPFWVPFTVHRTNPPVRDRNRSRFDFIHADGVYNEGLPFLICWVPLDIIDEDVGGLALVEGVHRQPSLHRKDGMKIVPIRLEDVPEGRWRRAVYRPGDVLLMSVDTPHSGLSNISHDRFRLSMDTRVMRSDGPVPVVGRVREVSAADVVVDDANGGARRLRFDDRSFVRGKHGDQMPVSAVPERYKAGDEVIIAFDGDVVRNMRPLT